ncbi:meiosis arrest female protein 1-like [Quillaja saponaria]|uniref:Meiosis arrest female protein 1-like n=1 Tax=Quillaja saponaria TaxID=32244 RepID=A0AAD7LEZ2_QUISA|nr:meiosis arrest female protein 1-like [Quillaja saponaria]
MRPLSPRSLFLFSLSSSPSSSSSTLPFFLKISHFSTSSNYQSYSRRQEEESRNVRVSVWWDFENCHLPVGVNVFKIANAITAAVRTNGIKGPVQITAFGDVLQLSRPNQEALSSTGINLTHIPNGGKNSADRSLLVDLMCWVSQNPPPAHLFLISGDRDFAGILHRLRMNNYNILLASLETAPDVLCSAASIMWHWNALVRGENLKGKHYNHPPDGPFNSWYGLQKVPLEDPFAVTEQPACARIEDVSEPMSVSKVRPVPRTVMRQIRSILKSQPKGLSLNDLREKLAKSDVDMDKDYYGHKKFHRFLLSMPHILQIKSGSDGQIFVHSVASKAPDSYESSAVPTASVFNSDDLDIACKSKIKVEAGNREDAGRKPSCVASPVSHAENPPEKVQEQSPCGISITEAATGKTLLPASPETHVVEPSNDVQHPCPTGEQDVIVASAQVTESHLRPDGEQISEPEVGFIQKMWRKLLGNDNCGSENARCRVPEKDSTSVDRFARKSANTLENSDTSGKAKAEDQCDSENAGHSIAEKRAIKKNNKSPSIDSVKKAQAMDQLVKLSKLESDPIHRVSHSSSSNEYPVEERTSGSAVTSSDNSRSSPGIFNRMISWLQFWKSGTNNDNLSGEHDKEMNHPSNISGNHELYSTDSFWRDMESFICTPRGSFIVSQSRTREEMVQNLQMGGPSILKPLSESDLLHLVDLLITEKKWVEECPSQPLPFRLYHQVGKSSSLSHAHGSAGLRSIFLSKTSDSDLQRSSEHDGEGKNYSIPQTGVSAPATSKKRTDRSRSDILADFQKLVNEMLREHPEGYNLGYFRKTFRERFGYPLDLQKLGYQKLASLLQIMPGVKIQSSYIIPSDKASYASDQLETSILDTQGSSASHALSNSDIELSDSAKKDDGNDSPWEELGPVSIAGSEERKMESKSRGKSTEQINLPKHPHYEPCISDEDFSDSEGEIPSLTGQQGRGNLRNNEEDSSLLQILDSWYSSKGSESSRNKSENVDATVDCLTDSLELSNQCTAGTNSESFTGNYRRKQKPQKTYTFVSDPVVNKKDKLIEGILGSLKKPSDSRMQH